MTESEAAKKDVEDTLLGILMSYPDNFRIEWCLKQLIGAGITDLGMRKVAVATLNPAYVRLVAVAYPVGQALVLTPEGREWATQWLATKVLLA